MLFARYLRSGHYLGVPSSCYLGTSGLACVTPNSKTPCYVPIVVYDDILGIFSVDLGDCGFQSQGAGPTIQVPGAFGEKRAEELI